MSAQDRMFTVRYEPWLGPDGVLRIEQPPEGFNAVEFKFEKPTRLLIPITTLELSAESKQ